MKLTVATNWDPALIEEYAKYPVTDVYGVTDHTIVGSARPSYLLKKVTEDEIVTYIENLHKKKINFAYALNAPCMNNMEYDSEYHRKLVEYIQWIKDIGTDSVIVTIPFLVQLIHEQFPQLKIRISTIAHVNSVNRAKFYESMGADEITPDAMINRDFITLEKMQKALKKSKLILLLTDGCLFQCPFRYYHYNILGHASQTYQQFNRHYIDFCLLNCGVIKYSDPTEAIKCRWVRPEDLVHYEAIGIDHFKIAGRRNPTPWLLRAVKAYSSRTYEGNLLDIIQAFNFTSSEKYKDDPSEKFVQSLSKGKKEILIIDNTKLDGFIEFFKKQNCNAMCDECNYCKKWAEKAVIVDKEGVADYVESLKSLIGDLVSSREFGLKPKVESKKKTGMVWDAETQRIFDALINESPQEFRSMARMVISQLSEANAKGRGASQVEQEDIRKAFLEGTPGPFQADMREGLKKYGLDPDK
ncbi:MAG: U32 family peptidase [Candidatus Helarchaeota archaeon]